PGGVDQELEPPRLYRVECRIGRQRKQARILLSPDALGGAGAEALIIVMDEPEGLSVLDDAQPIEAAGVRPPLVLGAPEIVRSVGGDKDSLRAVPQSTPVFLEIAQAKQIAADCRWRQQAGHDFDIKVVGLAERHIEPGTRCARPRERRGKLTGGEAQTRPRTLGAELVP